MIKLIIICVYINKADNMVTLYKCVLVHCAPFKRH